MQHLFASHIVLYKHKSTNTFIKHLNKYLRFRSQFKVSIFESLNWGEVKAPYHTSLSDADTDFTVLEQEVVYALFLNDAETIV